MKEAREYNKGEQKKIGDELYELIERLYPICRSITGNGVRETLRVIGEVAPIKITEIPSGTKVFDWTIPKEWNINDAYVMDPKGNKIVDFKKNNLHVLNYSVPVDKEVSLQELKEHMFSLPENPDLIPYRTSYYKETWGFCIEDKKLNGLKEGNYKVKIDSQLQNGFLTYGECYIPGETDEEIFISTHICHPSLCNDNLSGITISTFLAKHIFNRKHRYSYRFVFVPGTIGAISWLALNEKKVRNIKHGMVLSLLGDNASFTYKKSRNGDADIDRVVEYVLKEHNQGNKVIEFFPYGYDERQYCSPGFNLPVGCLMRSMFGTFPEYHTSGDNLSFVRKEKLQESFEILTDIFYHLEANNRYINLNPKCEPQLGKRGLYSKLGGTNDNKQMQLACLWILNKSDGKNDLLDVVNSSGLSFRLILEAADALLEVELLKELN